MYFCWKNVSSFCKRKSYSHFFSKNISVYAIFNDQSFNETLTNDIVIFVQPGPDHIIRTNEPQCKKFGCVQQRFRSACTFVSRIRIFTRRILGSKEAKIFFIIRDNEDNEDWSDCRSNNSLEGFNLTTIFSITLPDTLSTYHPCPKIWNSSF